MSRNNRDDSIVKVDTRLSQPIYKQIISSVHQAIEEGRLIQGDMLPSVNQIAIGYSIARGSIFKGYDELRASGIIDSIPGKGYFIANTNYQTKRNIFLLLSTFNPYREVLYNAFIKRIQNQATVDIYFHHHNIEVFDTLIRNHASDYNTFVIMPEIHEKTTKILQKLDQKKLYILDSGLHEFGNRFPHVCQNYDKDIFTFLQTNSERILKYKRVILLFPDNMRAYGIISGFQRFFDSFDLPAKVVKDTAAFEYRKHDFCIAMDDKDLVSLINCAKANNWEFGEDIGVVSYNETPLKSVVANGITTITTDFNQMGVSMADMILTNKRLYLENPFIMMDRNSF